MSIVNRIEKLERDFLWQGREEKRKFHLLEWRSICQPKKMGGLGIRPLKLVNQALLGKWLSRIGEDNNSLWRKIILAKYELGRNGWDIGGPSYRHSAIWKGITSVREMFNSHISFQVGSGSAIYFWLDVWMGDRPLAEQFPHLYRCARNNNAVIFYYIDRNSSQMTWSPTFRRNLRGEEERELLSLLDLLENFSIWGGGGRNQDSRR